jgi:hypothetical protein
MELIIHPTAWQVSGRVLHVRMPLPEEAEDWVVALKAAIAAAGAPQPVVMTEAAQGQAAPSPTSSPQAQPVPPPGPGASTA